ncbi:LOW QUALITY PROTEIN: 52 kDa repressor of the inhibitor of the protein kinase, partial [Frankliniella fusca]
SAHLRLSSVALSQQNKRLKTIDSFFKRQCVGPVAGGVSSSTPTNYINANDVVGYVGASSLSSSSVHSADVDAPQVHVLHVEVSGEGLGADAPISCASRGAPSVGDTDTVPNDIGDFIGKNISDFQKRELLENPWHPPSDYTFPYSTGTLKGKEVKRYVNHNHLDKYKSWLVLSHFAKGLFCKYCPWFSQKIAGGQKTVPLKALVTEPLRNFKYLLGNEKNSVLAIHEQLQYHKSAVQNGKSFLFTYHNPDLDVVNRVNQQRLDQIKENRERLVPIVRAILFLGRQGLALRGHRDDGQVLLPTCGDSDSSYASETVETLNNEGNFRELFRLMVSSGDTKLKEHLQNKQSRATCISKTSQNQIIKCIGDEVLQTVISRVLAAEFYAVSFDETTDASHKSQLSLILRYVDISKGLEKAGVREDFIAFIDAYSEVDSNQQHECTYQSDGDDCDDPQESKKLLVIRVLKRHNIPLDKCVGIATDGCSVMMSEVCGAVSEIQKVAKNAVRTPCFNHKLNLSILQSSTVTPIRNSVATMKECISFFNASAKRHMVIRQHLGHGLSGLCETRWVERHDGVLQFAHDLPKILDALEEISTWDDSSTSGKANGMRAALTDSFFLVSLHCLSDILSLTAPLSKVLQKKTLGLDEAASMVSELLSVLSERREKADEHFQGIWKEIDELANSLDTQIRPPRRYARQGNRPNYNTESIDAYFRQAVYIPLLDNVSADLKERFPGEVLNCFHLPFLLPVNIKGKSNDELKEKSKLFSTQFKNILQIDSPLCEKMLAGELTLWRQKWSTLGPRGDGDVPISSLQSLLACDPEVFTVIHRLLHFLTTLPYCPTLSFSALRRMKTWIRSVMSQERLTGLALIHIHRDDVSESYIERDITRFAKQGNRLVEFIV